MRETTNELEFTRMKEMLGRELRELTRTQPETLGSKFSTTDGHGWTRIFGLKTERSGVENAE